MIWARRLAPRSLNPSPLTDADEQVFADIAKTETRRRVEQIEVDFEETTTAIGRRHD